MSEYNFRKKFNRADKQETGSNEGNSGYQKKSYQKSSNGSGGNNDAPAFISVGSVSFPKNLDEKARDEALDVLRNLGASLWINVFLPNDVKSLELSNKMRLLVSFKKPQGDKVPEWIVGKAYLPAEE